MMNFKKKLLISIVILGLSTGGTTYLFLELFENNAFMVAIGSFLGISFAWLLIHLLKLPKSIYEEEYYKKHDE